MRSVSGSELSNILNLFVRIRNQFAHQDSIRSVFDKGHLEQLLSISRSPAGVFLKNNSSRFPQGSGPVNGFAFTEKQTKVCLQFSACTKVQINPDVQDGSYPIISWHIHAEHARNSIKMVAGIASSTAAILSHRLEQDFNICSHDYPRLKLRVQQGAWHKSDPEEITPVVSYGNKDNPTALPKVPVIFEPYAPMSRQ